MESKKDIGKAFREKLGSLQQSPPDAAWERLQAELKGKKKKRYILPFWLNTAAIILIIAGGFFTILNWEPGNNTSPVTPTKESINSNGITLDNSGKNTTDTNKNQETNTTGDTFNNNATGINNNTTVNTNNKSNSTFVNNTNNKEQYTTTPITPGINSAGTNTTHQTAGVTSEKNQSDIAEDVKEENTRKANRKSTITNNLTNRNIIASSSKKNSKPKSNANSGNLGGSDNEGGDVINNADIVQNANTAKSNTNNRANTINKGYEIVAAQPENEIASETGNTEEYNDTEFTKDETEIAANEARIKDSLKIEARNARIAQLREDAAEEDDDDDEDYIPALEPEKFYVFVHAGPAFYNLPDNESNIDPLLNNNDTSLKTSFNYGAYLGFILNDKLSLRIGFINTKMERTTNNVVLQSLNTENPIYPNGIMPPANYTGVEYRENVSNDGVLKTLGNDYTANIKLVQRAEFYEFPVEAVYNLYDNRAGINAVGGFSAFYLRNSTVTAKNENGSFNMGSLKNINDLSLSANLGLSLYYEITPGLKINAEPLFKYHLGNFGGSTLYSFNLQFGLQYTFNKNK